MMQLTAAVLFLLGSLYGDPTSVDSQNLEKELLASMPPVTQPITLEEHVRDYFKDDPILAEIARCESNFKHLSRSGKVMRGVVPEDVGVMQINEFYHENTADKLGINLHTLDGNLAYAKWLYNKEGTVPWASSGKCWQKYAHLSKAVAKNSTN